MTNSHQNFSDYLREYQAQGIGPLLYSLILEIVQQGIGRYPPQIYSPNETWDEDAISALAHDFALEKLLRLGWLEHYLLANDSTSGLMSALRRDFQHFLINRKKRSEYGNLFKRVRHILEVDSRFVACSVSSRSIATLWTLASSELPMLKGSVERLDEVLAAMFAVGLPPLAVYRADSLKLSHLISNKDLASLLEHTLRSLDMCVSFDLIMSGLRYRLNLLDIDVRSLEEPVGMYNGSSDTVPTYGDILASSSDVSSEVGVEETAYDLYERISDRQRLILGAFNSEEKPTLERIGMIVGVSKSTVSTELKTIAEQIDQAELSEEEAERVLAELTEICWRRYLAST